ncbi:uncharacterized protein SPSK_09418 [Sporothrix schenckii 1099-18]|uniref:Chitin-binding type-1 domain-containing protein n=2 Tax=Sporothrix schenckii TaxID=29908 RepID=U7Q5X1_SPOS1|nr:uncharacterized protein SPSK_09418 [Sporothrix schenckii 1099-18]ERT03294.1 hypothetical protein HMPREF1624_01602 [Sporothrix schenckii ATCC 58251]KJR84276.1 hypothetical protein SPSK_09418 [Sporothrix schenckii 1099-18]
MWRQWTILFATAASIVTATASAHGVRDLADSLASSTESSPAQASTLITSTDGTCGNGVTCDGSSFGKCCSEHGYCGDADTYCGTGCNAAFGTCNGGSGGSGSNSGSGSAPAGPVATSVVWLTETVTVSRTAVATSIVTSTSVIVSTSFVTATATETSDIAATRTSTVTSTAVVTRTSTVLSVSTVRTTTTVASTAVSTFISTILRTSVTIVTSTAIVTAGGGPTTPTSRPPTTGLPLPTVTTTVIVFGGGDDGNGGTLPSSTLWFPQPTRTGPGRAPPAATPSPVLKGTVSGCTQYYRIQAGDTCDSVSDKEDVQLVNLLTWNTNLSRGADGSVLCGLSGLLPIISSCKTSCESLPAGYYICVGA